MGSADSEKFSPYIPLKSLSVEEIEKNDWETGKRLNERAMALESGEVMRNAEVIKPEQLKRIGSKETLTDLANVLSGDKKMQELPQDIYCPDVFANSLVKMAEHSALYDQETEQVLASDGGDIYMLDEPVKNGTYNIYNHYYTAGPVMKLPEGVGMQALVHSHPRGVLALKDSETGMNMKPEDFDRESDNYSVEDLVTILTKGSGEDYENANASILVGTSHVNMLVRTKNTPERFLKDGSKKSSKKIKELKNDIREILKIDYSKAVHPQNLAALVKLRDKYGLAVYRMDLRKEGLNIWKKI